MKIDQNGDEQQEPEDSMRFNDIDLVEEDSSQDEGEEQDAAAPRA